MTDLVGEGAPEVDKELTDLITQVKGLTLNHNLLMEGSFPHRLFPQVQAAIEFLAVQHRTVYDACMAHPQAALVSELTEHLKKKSVSEVTIEDN